jgi:hypothetical protein
MKSTGFVPLKPSNLPKVTGGGFVPKILPPPSGETLAASADASPAAPAPHASHGQPSVQLHREGDRVTGISVRCGCGQVIELQCSY